MASTLEIYFLTILEAGMSMIKVTADLVSAGGPLPGFLQAAPLCFLMWQREKERGGERERETALRCVLYKDIDPIGLGPHLYNFIYP